MKICLFLGVAIATVKMNYSSNGIMFIFGFTVLSLMNAAVVFISIMFLKVILSGIIEELRSKKLNVGAIIFILWLSIGLVIFILQTFGVMQTNDEWLNNGHY